jgi:hypothetical protein
MATLLYIHGFLSSPESFKAQVLKQWLSQNRPDINYLCPFLRPYPKETADTLDAIVNENQNESLYLIGSSFGGFWATYLVEKYNLPAVIINPAIDPSMLEPDYINVPLKNYHIDEDYLLTKERLDQFLNVAVSEIRRKEKYWLLVQSGDETLDYRMAVDFYSGCRQTVETGGDHGFKGVDKYIPKIIEFFERAG